ncbi:hypothetical protein [Arthrobacter oryzae]|nr:hypothetical protein [Arthrobacter oryzae]WLQ05831.1 hypothetical protein Q8Z05_17220 [Arthrobacter oryzae]
MENHEVTKDGREVVTHDRKISAQKCRLSKRDTLTPVHLRWQQADQ